MLSQKSYNKHNLVVYTASAGSGKTYRLTGEYLRLLFSSPYAYRHILAVTFTNKATEEMKSRIIQELANLALDRESAYLKELMSENAESETNIRQKAKSVLVRLLHDYSAFSISTIDRFFQQTMRAFIREIGVGGGYNIELDTAKVLREAIDSMLYGLEKNDNEQLLDWLIRFSEEKIQNGETWNIRRDIQSLSSEIFKETYKIYSDSVQKDIADKHLLKDYKSMLIRNICAFESRTQEIARRALNIIGSFTLSVQDFKNKNRSPFMTFAKWAQGETNPPSVSFLNLIDNIDNWYTNTTPPDIKLKIEEAYNAGLNDCIRQAAEHFESSRNYQTSIEINRYLFALGILGDVDKKVKEYTSENNIMLISDTTELLNKIIGNTESPFIYERTGTFTDHYMIDEFQDTSEMQWSNFKPLIKDSLASGNKNLIVGDIKQSIYRWRNSDWKILAEQLDNDFHTEGITHKSLDTNWRSAYNIVNFNNALFRTASRLLQEEFNEVLPAARNDKITALSSKIENAYANAYQAISLKNKDVEGHVKIEFIDLQINPDWYIYVLDRLPETIEKLQEKGYSLKDIAILVRTKKEGADIANRLLEYKAQNPESKYAYDIISDEALFVRNSKSIRLVISILRFLLSPGNKLLRDFAVYEYYLCTEQLSPETTLRKHFYMTEDFPEHILSDLEQAGDLPLYEMTERILEIFHHGMNSDENIYIQSFLDMVLDFTTKQSSDLDAFLQWWDESGSSKTIFTSEGQDAIRILTIHKSKGLDFNVVLIPFCNWDIDHKLINILWCHPKVEPFNRLQLVPVKYSQKLKNTIFENEYFDEKIHAYIDNLNILYVAFTRARKELIVFAPKPLRDKVSNISSLLWKSIADNSVQQEKEWYLQFCDNLNEGKDIFDLGENYLPGLSDKEILSDDIQVYPLSSIPFDNRLKLKLNNKYFFSENGQREYGTLMHEIISNVDSIDNLDEIVDTYYLSGDITEPEKDNITNILRRFLSREVVADWYSGKFLVMNEIQILHPDGSFVRPDRVMIDNNKITIVDFKFGEKEESKYINQVKYYISQVAKMGEYNDIDGYICYIALDKIIRV